MKRAVIFVVSACTFAENVAKAAAGVYTHVAVGAYTNCCPLFAFENCDNVVFKHCTVIRRGVSKETTSEVLVSQNCTRLRTYGIRCRFE